MVGRMVMQTHQRNNLTDALGKDGLMFAYFNHPNLIEMAHTR